MASPVVRRPELEEGLRVNGVEGIDYKKRDNSIITLALSLQG